MRVFVVGGTGFTGPPLIVELLERGHDVSYFHRGRTRDPRLAGARELLGDRRDVGRLAAVVAEAAPEVIVDMIPFTAGDARGVQQACRGLDARVVALSSIDVYLAYGRIWGTEPGPLQPTPLRESDELRATDQPEGPARDKVGVERTYGDRQGPPATILRLPAIHGPGDRLRRLHCYLKRMDDERRAILLGASIAAWRFSRSYVDNVAHAIVLAVESRRGVGEVFNVGEPRAMSEREFVRAIGEAAGWSGEVRVVPDASLPSHLRSPVNFAQDWEVDSSKIRAMLGYAEIVGVAEGLRWTVEWERGHPPEEESGDDDYAAEDAVLSATESHEPGDEA